MGHTARELVTPEMADQFERNTGSVYATGPLRSLTFTQYGALSLGAHSAALSPSRRNISLPPRSRMTTL
jgi:hypothetical protein